MLIPPMDLSAEHAALGAVLQPDAGGVLARLAEELGPADFYTEAHRTIFARMLALRAGGQPVDAVTLGNALAARGELTGVGGPAKLAQLVEDGLLAIPANVGAYAEIIAAEAQKRSALVIGQQLVAGAGNGGRADELLTDAARGLAELIRRGTDARRGPLGVGLGDFLAIAELELPSEEYIEGILNADSSGWITGEEKTSKTMYAIHEALCLALGRPVCGRFAVPQRRRVFFLEEEDPARRMQARIRAQLRGQDLDPDDPAVREDLNAWFQLHVWAGFTFDDAAMVARLRATIETFEPKVVYLDVLRKLTLRDLNKQPEAAGVLAILDELHRAYGVVFRVLHHYRKAQTFRVGRGSQEISGSYVLGAWGESSLFFEPIGRKQGAVRVQVQTKDGAPVPGFRLRIEAEGPAHAPTLLRLVAEEDAAAGTDDIDELVAQAIATLPKTEALAGKPGVLRAQVMAAVKKSDKTIRRALDRLTDAGRIVVTGNATKRAALYAVKE
jgi:hypothetical protein